MVDIKTTMGALVDIALYNGWVQFAIISDQGDVREVIGPFKSIEGAQHWIDTAPRDPNEKFEIVHILKPHDEPEL